ncbi:MAG: hypothetical protein KIT46_07880 [Anaerolineales bacterium]|nr:hypothetical protein [Anaerolineales bacterium]MCW5855949.1 hypothetical protein [Anaerolineales bacterium]
MRKMLFFFLIVLTLLLSACVRSATDSDKQIADLATEMSAATADAQVQMTLEALLNAATLEVPSETPEATPTEEAAEPTATVEQAQLTALALALTEAASSDATPEATEAAQATTAPSASPTANPTAGSCYGARYVYDETYPDGTRVNAGQAMQKTWRLQNVGTCNWVAGEYELVFIGGTRMNGQNPLTITFGVLAGNYANFSINLVAPAEPGTYRGEWMLRSKGGDTFGVGPDFNLPIWIEIIVRG